jgi:alanine racemase
MEKMVVRVNHIPEVGIGDEAVLLGRQGDDMITADELAERLGTVNYEVLTSVLARVPRR